MTVEKRMAIERAIMGDHKAAVSENIKGPRQRMKVIFADVRATARERESNSPEGLQMWKWRTTSNRKIK